MSFLSGKAISNRANVTASKRYNTRTDYRFDMTGLAVSNATLVLKELQVGMTQPRAIRAAVDAISGVRRGMIGDCAGVNRGRSCAWAAESRALGPIDGSG